MRLSWMIALCGCWLSCLLSSPEACSSLVAGELRAGFGEVDITPELQDDRPVWLAGYGPGRRATGVHDPLMARCLVLGDEKRKVALVSTDLVGVQLPLVKRIRAELKDLDYVLVASTHNHEGPDVIGIWGASFAQRGVDDRYLDLLVKKIVGLVRDTEKKMLPAAARYGIARDDSLVGDSRKPVAVDGILRVLAFQAPRSDTMQGILVQWNCHPEALGSKNTQITADFPAATVAALKKKYACPIVYFSGALGGLMAPPDNRIKDDRGEVLKEGDFEYAKRYGEAVAELASQAVSTAGPLDLLPMHVSHRAVHLPVPNMYYRTAHAIGVLRREARVWTGDPEKAGPPLKEAQGEATMAVETEVAYLRLGSLHVAAIPGEIYPELVYGSFQEPADPGADFPQAPLEPTVASILPDKNWLLFGLANDEIGYIIPKRQWDAVRPFAYGRKSAQYGEINSCGPEVADILMQALRRCVQAAAQRAR